MQFILNSLLVDFGNITEIELEARFGKIIISVSDGKDIIGIFY